ncbi:hypothetical protein ACWGJ9_11065 [Curtobacterium citreum]
MRTFQNGMYVTFIGTSHTSLIGDVGTVESEGDTVHVAYKHVSISLDAADLIINKGQRVRLGRIAGTVLEPANIWQRAERLNKDRRLEHTTPVYWDDDTVSEEPTKNLSLSDIPASVANRTPAVNSVIDEWWAATEKTGVYEEDVEQLKLRLAHII